MRPQPKISAECLDLLHTWIMAHCPCALEDEHFLPGLKIIVEEETIRARQEERSAILKALSIPKPQ